MVAPDSDHVGMERSPRCASVGAHFSGRFSPARRALLRAVSMVFFLSYPLLVFFGLQRLDVRSVSVLLVGLVVASALVGHYSRAATQEAARRSGVAGETNTIQSPKVPLFAIAPLATCALLLGAAFMRDRGYLLAVPVVTSLIFLAAFGFTFVSGPPMVERFARLIEPTLSSAQERWCRRWTYIWCVFFLLNALLTAALAARSSLFWWTLHTSLLSYIAVGVLLATEYLLRKRRFGGTP